METSGIITLCDLRSQGIELFRRRLGCIPWASQLAFANRMHHLYARDRTAGRPKGFEAEHGTSKPFHGSMILLHDIIEILAVANNDGRLLRLIVVRNGCGIRATLIDGDFFWQPLGANGLA